MKYFSLLKKTLAVITVMVLFLPIMILAITSDIFRLLVNFQLFIFANLCYYVADKGFVPFKDVLEHTNYNL